MIELQDVELNYERAGQTVPALRGITLAVSAGTFLAIQGPSGAGKSSLLLVTGGLLRPQGTVLIDGTNLYEMDSEKRAIFRSRHIGFIFQRFHLLPYLSARQNILSPTLTTSLPDANKRADELLAEFGLEHRAEHLPGQMSAGECQRVATARALLLKPKIILADEPTGNLDDDNALTALDAIRKAVDEGAAAILVTHDQQSATRADKIIYLNNGHLQADKATVDMGPSCEATQQNETP